MKIGFILLLLVASATAQNNAQHSAEYRSADRKIAAMDAYDAGASRAGRVTVLTDAEMNAFFAEGGVKWPDGVSDVKIDDQPAVVNGSGQVDFDKVTAKNRSSNPMLALFSGVHGTTHGDQRACVGEGTIGVAGWTGNPAHGPGIFH